MSVRKIIQIDEDLCDGCGECVPSCAEGAIQIIDGKARLVGDNLCDGLGACLGECPQDALKIIERNADEFDEDAVEEHFKKQLEQTPNKPVPLSPQPHGGGCPGSRVMQFNSSPAAEEKGNQTPGTTGLGHWPIKMRLVPPQAQFLKDKDLILAADCVAFAYPDMHRDQLPGNALLIGCPKFDNPEADLEKLTAILTHSGVRSLTVMHMEVPCCFGYTQMAQQALAKCGRDIPFKRIELTLDGKIKDQGKQSITG